MSQKFVLFGAAKVGKTSLVTRIAEDTFAEKYRATMGTDFKNANIQVDGRPVRLHMMELAGDPSYRTDSRTMLSNPDAILLVFDITEQATYDELDNWLEEARALGQPSAPIVLIGNKSDLSENRVVSQSQAEQFARDHNLSYIETSALNGTNVREAFVKAACGASEAMKLKEMEAQREMEEMEEKRKIKKAQKLKNDADQGDATAQKEYADCLMNGRGVERNASEAARYFKMAGDQGNLEALFGYAILLAKGEGVEANLSEALRCIDTVAEKGPAEVKFVCGLLFADGESFTDDVKQAIPPDLKKAARYWKMAADEGFTEAQRRLDELKDKVTEE